MFRALPLVAVYQNGVGYSRFGFNEILPFEDYVAIMNNAAVDFNNQNFEDKQRYMDRVFNISMNPRNRIFKNFVSAAFVSTTPTFEKKDRFTVIPQAGVKDAKAVTKASIATQFIGFGEGIVGKDGKRSTTQIYREQAGTLANTGKYSGTDVIFVSVPGLRGDAAIVKREQDKTIREAIKAIEAGATILTDNKAYIDSSSYNTGEKRLYQNLEAKGYNYSEIKIDGQLIGTWRKTTQPATSVKEGVSELFDSNFELAKIGTQEEYSQYLDGIFPDSKVKDIVYRGAEDTSARDYLYFTKVKGEAYAFSKANITKSGNITERNPINAINVTAEKYFNSKYGSDAYATLTLEDNFAAIIYESLDPLLLDENYNLTEEGQKEYEKLKTIDSRKKELLKTVNKEDKSLLENIKVVKTLYPIVKIESEADLTKPYDDLAYQENINKYNKARKSIDEILSPSKVRQNIGVITTALINIKNPYVDEIVQEDLKNDRDAFKNGHDGAFLNDGDHFLVKPEQAYKLGSKQDIKGFKEFVSGKPTTQPSTQPTEGVKTILPQYGVVQASTNPTKDFDQKLVNAVSSNIKNNAYVENGSSTANLMFSYGWQWKGNNTKNATGEKLKVEPAQVDFNATGNLQPIKPYYFYDSKYNDGTPVPNIEELNFLKRHIEKTLGIDLSNYDVALNNIYVKGTNLYRHTDIDESNTAKDYPVVVYVLGNDHKVRVDDNGGKAIRGAGQMVNPKTLTLKNGDIYTFGMDGKGRFEAVHDVVKSEKTDDSFPPITLPDGTITNKYTITFTFRRAADLEPGMPTTPAKIGTTQPTEIPTVVPVVDVRILNNLQKLKEFGIYNVFLSRKTYEEEIDNIDKGYPSFIYGKVGIGPEKIDTYELLTPQEISDVYNRIVNKIKNGGLTEVVAKNYILDLNIIRSQIGKLGESNDLSNSVEDFISGKTDTTLTLEDQRDIDPIEQMVIDKYITLKLLKENDLASRYINVFASFALKKIAVSILKLKGRNVTKDIESQFYNNINDEEKSIIEKVDNIINKKGQATLEEAKPAGEQLDLFNQEEEENNLTLENQNKTTVLNSKEFKDWFTNEEVKNPDLDIMDALDYYMKCKR
jgi:hypothetical protein